ncbi:hypothetical protein SAMN04487820_110258 [Actinopolyspora mzabensis]|uniref:Uncharacterized protein n=1 Tax=Actinopolyspora mzabensis TaxID=995066 RepID=A0A1G9DRH8_ACTMZ|nr:hypothetical protein SAMN04487820_110258 [Actinopolyspora mzabensis]
MGLTGVRRAAGTAGPGRPTVPAVTSLSFSSRADRAARVLPEPEQSGRPANFDQQSSSMFDSAFCSAESTLRPQTCFTLIQLRAYTQW